MYSATEKKQLYKYDTELALTNHEFGRKLHKHLYDVNIATNIPFPSDFTLAQLSQQAYNDTNFSFPENWELITIATSASTGYFGIAVWNPKLCQIAIAHRGTKANVGAYISDAQLALKKKNVRQLKSAAAFVDLISQEVKAKNSEAPFFQLSITGHSLGAWLAQMTTFTLKFFKNQENKFVEDRDYARNIHAHTVVFESPGCKETMTKLVEMAVPRYSNRRYGNYTKLDLTVYLSELNPINSINRQVGRIYMVRSKSHSIKEIISLFDEKTHRIFREIVYDFPSGIFASSKLVVKRYLPFSYSENNLEKKPVSDNECSLNVFTEDELDFVKDWTHVLKQNSVNVQEFKKKNSVPDFNIDYEFNTFAANNLEQTVACLKHLRLDKTIIFDLLERDVDDRAYYEIFKLEAEHFRRDLLYFHGIFRDKYNLQEFLRSNHRILHIRIDSESTLDYELETSILRNILDFYQRTTNSFFLSWSKLKDMLAFLPNILKKNRQEFSLLIIECFESFAEQVLIRFLHKNDLKTIIVTTDTFSWTKHFKNSLQEVTGFGSKITFQDLTEDSQKLFMTQNSLVLNKRKISVSDLIKAEFPWSDEEYNHINKAFPNRSLLELLLSPDSKGTIIMDCPYNNPLDRVVFIDLYHKIDLNLLRRNDEQAVFVIHYDQNQEFYLNIEADKDHIKLQVDFEKTCWENSSKTHYLFVVQNGEIYLTRIFNKNLYLLRNILLSTTISSEIFSDINDTDQYYFCGNKEKFKQMVLQSNPEQRKKFKFVDKENVAKSMVRNSKINAHLMKIDESISCVYSRGNMESLRNYLSPREICIPEIKASQNDLLIICGEPGMGKSSTIGNLFMELQKTHWVFALPLKHAFFEGLTEINFDSAANFILQTSGISDTNFVHHLLVYCLKNQTSVPIYLMFDAFDEIHDKESRKKLIALVNFLKDACTAKILVTTRKFRCKELENGISIIASYYEAFNKEVQIIEYFTRFWFSQLRLLETGMKIEKIRQFAIDILEDAQNNMGETITNFIGIPMQMRMMAEVIQPPTSSSSPQINFINILNLYEKYTKIHYATYFEKTDLPNNETLKEWLSNSISAKLYRLAIAKMFSLNMDGIGHNDIEELNKIGLIQSDPYDDFNSEFLHDSVRDYFVAYLLKLWLESHFELDHTHWNVTTFIIAEFVLEDEYKEMRLFLNSYLETMSLSVGRLEICQNKMQLLWENDKNLFYNNEESCFHICVKENLHFLIQHFLFRIIISVGKTELLGKRNWDLQTPIFLALQRGNDAILKIIFQELQLWSDDDIKTVLLSTLFTYFVTDTHFDQLDEYAKQYPNVEKILQEIRHNYRHIKPFLEACKLNQIDTLQQILDVFCNDKIARNFLLLTTNERKETCLHLTSTKEILDRLLKLSANKDLQDYHGMTPLSRSIKAGHTDIAITLIQKGALLSADKRGNSSLFHAVKYGNEEVVKLLLKLQNPAPIDVNERNIFEMTPLMVAAKNGHESIARYLLDKEADVSATDWNGMTPLYHAVKGGHTNFISIFRKRGADVNVQDVHKFTPLLYSITKQRWNAVISLLDNGADVNIGNGRDLYPLKLLIADNRHLIVSKILEEKVQTSKEGGVIFTREAANLDILSEQERKYIMNLPTKKNKLK